MVDQASTKTGSEKLYDLVANYSGRLICYLITGIGVVALCYYDGFDEPAKFIENSGTLTAVGFLLFGGFILFNFYQKLFGELFLYQFQHHVHHSWDKLCGLSGDHQTSPIYLLIHYKTEKSKARRAYRKVRFYLYKNDDQFYNQMKHTEVHILYIFFFLCLAQSFIERFSHHNRSAGNYLLMACLVTYVFVLYYDTTVHSAEADDIRSRKQEIIDFVDRIGMLSEDAKKNRLLAEQEFAADERSAE